jgi:hypothetical protein
MFHQHQGLSRRRKNKLAKLALAGWKRKPTSFHSLTLTSTRREKKQVGKKEKKL